MQFSFKFLLRFVEKNGKRNWETAKTEFAHL